MDIKVPTKPYLKRYLHRKHPQPYRIRMDDLFGTYLYHLLRDGDEVKQYDHFIEQYQVKYTIRLNKYQVFGRSAYKITAYMIYRFNSYVENMFRKELFDYLELCEEVYESTHGYYTIRNSPYTIKSAIYRFLDKYNIDQGELSYQTLKKAYYRHRKKNEKKTPCKLSPELMGSGQPRKLAKSA